MASALALVAAMLFALAAALQQRGALGLPEVSVRHPSSIARLAAQTMWLVGTVALLVGYLFQAAALDRGRLSIIQPLLVTTVVFALPLGYFLTSQRVGRREVVGAAVIVLGLALFAIFGDPAGGREDAPGSQWATAILVLAAFSAACSRSPATGASRAERRHTARRRASSSVFRPHSRSRR
jgi:drug/metabolite transporter (DMT)-like permease